MRIRLLYLLCLCFPLAAQAGSGTWNSVQPATWNSVQATSWNGSGINFIPAPSITLVQQKVGTVASGNLVITLDNPPTAGNQLYICIGYVDSDLIASVSLNGNGSGIEQTSFSGTGIAGIIWRIAIDSSGAAGTKVVTITPTTGLTRISANVSEWSGLIDTSKEIVADGSDVVSDTTSFNHVPFDPPLSTRNLTIAFSARTGQTVASGPTGGFTALTAAGSGAVLVAPAYLIQSTAVAPDTTWTFSANAAAWVTVGAIFGAP